jgi:hypothetical protein
MQRDHFCTRDNSQLRRHAFTTEEDRTNGGSTTKNRKLGKRLGCSTVGSVSPAGLPEVGSNVVELSPGDCHLAAICRINGDGALIRRVAEDILPTCIDVHLVTDE